MHKIDTDTAVNSEFTDGVPESGQPATRLNAKWFNTIQRELCNIVTKAGMGLSESDDSQVLNAILVHAVAEILGDKSHDGTLKLAGESGVNAVLRENGIWFEYPESGVHTFVSKDGFGYHYVDENGDTVEVSLNKDGLFIGNEDGNIINLKLSQNGLFFGDVIKIINGTSELKNLYISGKLLIDNDGEFTLTGVFSVKKDGVSVNADFRVGDAVKIFKNGNIETSGGIKAHSIGADRSVGAPVFCSQIFDATLESTLLNPESLLGEVALAGATALVRNATGKSAIISRFEDSSNIMTLIVRNGEILRYVYDGSKWVHSW